MLPTSSTFRAHSFSELHRPIPLLAQKSAKTRKNTQLAKVQQTVTEAFWLERKEQITSFLFFLLAIAGDVHFWISSVNSSFLSEGRFRAVTKLSAALA